MKRQCVLALLLTVPLVATAQAVTVVGPELREVRTETVRYDVSDVYQGKSVKKLFFGIRQAAEEVCRISSHPTGYEIWDEHACEADAVAQAVRESGVPALEEYYFGRSGDRMARR